MSDECAPVAEYRRLMEVLFAFSASQALIAAVDLGVFSLFDERPMNGHEASTRLGLNARGSLELMDALATLGLLQRSPAGYANSPVASRCLVAGRPDYVGDFVSFVGARLYPVWAHLPDALRTGEPQNEARTEEDYYANLGEDTARHERFLKGMVGLSARPAQTIATRFPWQRYRSFIDLGGASGSLAATIVASQPHLRGGVFDLPTIEPYFDALTAGGALPLAFHAGDFFTDPLPSADVIILGHVLHNWSADEKRRLLTRAYEAASPGGAIVVYEWLLDEARQSPLALMMSLNMLLVTRGGGGMTAAQCEGLLRDTGCASTEAWQSDEPFTVVVGWKG